MGKRDVIQDKVITLPLAIIVKAVNTPRTAVSVLEAGSNQPSDHLTQWLQVLWWPLVGAPVRHRASCIVLCRVVAHL